MICHLCKEDKLHKEFPFHPLTERCDHPLLHCLKCVTESVKNSQKCSQCEIPVQEDNKQYQKYIAKLNFLFPVISSDDAVVQNTPILFDVSSHIMVTTLSGECVTVEYSPNLTVQKVKSIVEKELGTPTNKQCLLHEDTELKSRNQNNEIMKLNDYNVKPNSTLSLLVLLYAIPEGFDKVVFDLFWGYPMSGRDYLDASVLLYSGSSFIGLVDYNQRQSQTCSGVQHSGDVMDDAKRLGHHTIKVSIKSIPTHINKLVFTLSAWNSPNISRYPNPSLRFFEENFPSKQLCSDEMSHAGYSQAIIMCCLSKRGGQWKVFSLKTMIL